MPAIPAICESCGALFPSQFSVAGAGTATIVGCQSGPCPACGGVGRIPDGLYGFAEGVLTVLTNPRPSVDTLRRLSSLLQAARERQAAPDEVRAEVERELPDIGQRVASLMVPKTPSDFWTLVGVLVALIGIIVTWALSDKKPATDAAAVLDQLCAPAVREPYRAGVKHGRNERCACGSGKKYKFCCGR